MFLIEDAVERNGWLFASDADADAATENETCLTDGGDCGGECPACETRFTSVETFHPDCEDCVWQWDPVDGYWTAYVMCRECGEEEYILQSAGL